MIVRRSTPFAALAVLPLVAFAAQAEETPAAAPQALPAIVVTQATPRLLTDRIVATGSVKPVEEIYIQPQVDGLQTRTLNADIGDRVKEGDVLAVLSDDSLLLQKSQLAATRAKAEASLAQIRAQLVDTRASAEDAERQRARATTLSAKGTVSTSQLEQAETAATGAKARLRAAEQSILVAEAELEVIDAQISDIDLKLARTSVKTPASGLVSARTAKVGAIASSSSQPMFTVIRDGQIELVADVTESDILRVRPGLKALIRVAGTSEALTGQVRLVSPTVDATTRLGSVHIAIDDDDKARTGMYASAEIVLAEANGLSLPLSAITTSKDGVTVRLVKDGIVHQVKVETGIQDGSFIQVTKGLDDGAEVVAKAGAFVRDGDHIAPVKQTATTATD